MKETEESFSLTSLEEANVKSEERRAEEPIDAPVSTNNLSSDLEKERPSLAEDHKPQKSSECITRITSTNRTMSITCITPTTVIIPTMTDLSAVINTKSSVTSNSQGEERR